MFRGATIAGMLLVNGQYSPEVSYRQLTHAAWHGWTFADTVFPSFLFIVGVSLTLSTASRLTRGQSKAHLIAHALQRSLLIFACGVVVDYLRVPIREFPFVGLQDHLQLTGVLQKIAVCYLVAFLIHLWAGLPGVLAGIVCLNLLYLSLLYFYPMPGCGPGSLAMGCNFAGYLDATVLDGFRSNSMAFDPDGVASILPATTSVLFGVLAGYLLLNERRPRHLLLWLVSSGLVLFVAGQIFSIWVPINKQLWTTSFAVLMAGMAAVGLACAIWLVDRTTRWPHWLRPLEILGANALAAYVISRLIGNMPKVHVMGKSLYADVLSRIANPSGASLLFAIVVLAGVYVVVWLMHRRGWHLKL